jgi:hypothetical protein
MENTRRSFLRGAVLGGIIAATPGPLRIFTRIANPRWVPTVLRVSTPALRATWPAIAAVTSRAAVAHACVIAAGGAGGAVLNRFVRTRGLPFWFNPVFRPSLRNLTDGSVR